MKYTLRDYQRHDVEELRARFRRGDKAVLYTAPTGSGKTVLFSYITEGAAKRGNSVMILVHRQELLRQSSDKLTAIGLDHGLIAPGFTSTWSSVQIASVQTLVRRLDRVQAPDLIVVDECHHSIASTWSKILNHFSSAKILGVTATPMRTDQKGLGKSSGGFFDSLVNGPKIADLVGQGFLSPARIFAPPINADFKGLHKRYGDFVQAEVEAMMDKPVITGCAISHYKKLCHNVPAIAFCASVAHAEHVAEQFRASGYQAASIDGKMHDQDRKGRLTALANGNIHVLVSVDLVSEGFDLPCVGAAILLRPTESLGLYMQQVGRALRPAPGKEFATILDHVNNVLRHGFPDEDREWSLDGEVKRKKKDTEKSIAIRQCSECYHVHKRAPVCPECGFEYPNQGREIKQVDGDLVELSRLEKIDAQREKEFKRRQEKMEEWTCRSYEDFLSLANKRGYPKGKGWAWFQWSRSKYNKKEATPQLQR